MVVIPEDEVVIAGFKEGEELKIYSEDGKITLIRDQKNQEVSQRNCVFALDFRNLFKEAVTCFLIKR